MTIPLVVLFVSRHIITLNRCHTMLHLASSAPATYWHLMVKWGKLICFALTFVSLSPSLTHIPYFLFPAMVGQKLSRPEGRAASNSTAEFASVWWEKEGTCGFVMGLCWDSFFPMSWGWTVSQFWQLSCCNGKQFYPTAALSSRWAGTRCSSPPSVPHSKRQVLQN